MKLIKPICIAFAIFTLYIFVQMATGLFVPESMIFDASDSERILLIANIVNLIIFSLFLFFYNGKSSKRKHSNFYFSVFAFIPILSITLYISTDLIFRFDNIFRSVPLPEEASILKFKDSYYAIINSLIIAPLIEELVFREILFKVIFKYVKSWKLWMTMSTFCFTFLHIDSPETIISALVIGIVFCVIYMKQGLLFSIIAHVFYNVCWLILNLNNDIYLAILKGLDFNLSYFSIIFLSISILIFLLIKLPLNPLANKDA